MQCFRHRKSWETAEPTHEQAPPMIDAITEGLLQNDSFETMVANDYTASSVLRMETVRIL